MAVPPARAAGRAELIAAASSAGWRVATSQYGVPAAGPVTSTCGRHRRHLSRRRGTPPAAGSVTSMYTASRRYGLISVNAAGSARGTGDGAGLLPVQGAHVPDRGQREPRPAHDQLATRDLDPRPSPREQQRGPPGHQDGVDRRHRRAAEPGGELGAENHDDRQANQPP